MARRRDDLAWVAYKNYAHARLNPLAQMRDADLTYDCASQVSDKNPSVAPPLRVSDCSQITDGAAALVLGFRQISGQTSASINRSCRACSALVTRPIISRLEKKDAPTFTTARKAAEKAFGMANLKPRDMHGAEVHDCFSITEIVAYEILGLAETGQRRGAGEERRDRAAAGARRTRQRQDRLRDSGQRRRRLIGDGHPVGATGVRQVVEAYQQLTEQAGARQIEGAKSYLTFNMGGSLTTSVAMIWGRD